MSELLMTDVEFAVRPETLTSQASRTETRPPSHGRVQALAQSQQSQPSVTPERLDPFAASGEMQPSDHGYDDYWLDPIEP